MPQQHAMHSNSSEQMQALTPVPASERISTIDVLRGFALFGIILINTWWLQRIFLPSPILYEELWTEPVDRAVSWFIEFFIEARFWRLFSFLFGLGIAMQFARAERRNDPFVGKFVRRLLVLLLFGAAHVLFRGGGDILVLYALLGFLVLPFRKASPRAILIAAAICLVVPWIIGSYQYARHYDYLTAPSPSAKVLQMKEDWEQTLRAQHERAATVKKEGSWEELIRYNVWHWYWEFGASNPVNLLEYLRMEFLMFLLGLYAGRRRIFENVETHVSWFRKVMWSGLIIGVVTVWFHRLVSFAEPGAIPLPYFTERVADLGLSVGGPAFTFFYVAGITLMMRSLRWQQVLAPLATVGKMPLSNYLLHTIIHVALFNGVGLGLWGDVTPAGTVGISLLMCVAIIFLSTFWMNRFRFGPAEWLWRTVTYARIQPMRLRATQAG